MATEVTCIVDTGNGAGTHYTSLAAAIAGETGATPAVVTGANLVTADEQLTIKCRCTGGTADGAATIDGFTTDATRYVKIWTDPTESYRHAGTYPTGNKYRIEVTNTTGIQIRDEYIAIAGIAMYVTDSGNSNSRGIVITTGSVAIDISKCIILGVCSGTGTGYGIYCYIGTATTTISNTIVYGFASGSDTHYYGLYFNAGSPAVYNCTITECYRGVSSSGAGTHTIKNCVFFNNTNDTYTVGATQVIDHCASDDLDGTNAVDISPGATEADDWAACFTDYANGDFSLKSGSVCIGAGVDDPGSGLYSDDILGNARTSTWDIGAFEYVAAGPATGALSGTASGSSSNVGGLGGIGVVAGGLAGTSAHQASVGGLAGLSGSVPAYATGSMSMGLIGLLSANASGASSASGGIGGIGLVSGLVQGSVTVTGGLVFDSMSGELIGIISGGSMLAGTVHGIAELSGSVAGSSYVTGRIRYPSAPSASSSYRAIIGGMNQASVRMLSSRHVRRVGQ